MKKVPFVDGEYYHIYNRGVEKRDIFLGKRDYRRFVFNLYDKNNSNRCANACRKSLEVNGEDNLEIGGDIQLVDIVCYCLMPNHFHLLLKQVCSGGISLFMQKIGTGYTQYFNLKYGRSGVLFQGTFKAKYIGTNEYILHLSRYIHLNSLELYDETKGEAKDLNGYVKAYPWSSLPFYLASGTRDTQLVKKSIIIDQFSGNEREYESFIFSDSMDSFTEYIEYIRID